MPTSLLTFDGLKAVLKAEEQALRSKIDSIYTVDFLSSELINALHKKGALSIHADDSMGEGIASPRYGKVGQLHKAQLAGDQSEKVV